jgi:hypothetical protein
MPNNSVLKSQTVIVSAFMSQINDRPDRILNKYIDFGKKLVGVDLPKIIFIEKSVFDTYSLGKLNDKYVPLKIDPDKPEYECVIQNETQTMYVFFEKSMMYLYEYKHLINDFYLDTTNPKKDTIEYMFVQCHKTEWIRMAIQAIEYVEPTDWKTENTLITKLCDFSENNQYIWMDFGLYHMFMNDESFYYHLNGFHDRIETRFKAACMNGHTFDTVYFASCWNPYNEFYLNIYTQIYWVFAGSVFGGYRSALLRFAELVREKCIQIIREKRHLMWEINVWYLVYKVCPGLFDFYKCDHNHTIIAHY